MAVIGGVAVVVVMVLVLAGVGIFIIRRFVGLRWDTDGWGPEFPVWKMG